TDPPPRSAWPESLHGTPPAAPRALHPVPNDGNACRIAPTAASSRSPARAAAIFSPSRTAPADRPGMASGAPDARVGETALHDHAGEKAACERGSHEFE